MTEDNNSSFDDSKQTVAIIDCKTAGGEASIPVPVNKQAFESPPETRTIKKKKKKSEKKDSPKTSKSPKDKISINIIEHNHPLEPIPEEGSCDRLAKFIPVHTRPRKSILKKPRSNAAASEYEETRGIANGVPPSKTKKSRYVTGGMRKATALTEHDIPIPISHVDCLELNMNRPKVFYPGQRTSEKVLQLPIVEKALDIIEQKHLFMIYGKRTATLLKLDEERLPLIHILYWVIFSVIYGTCSATILISSFTLSMFKKLLPFRIHRVWIFFENLWYDLFTNVDIKLAEICDEYFIFLTFLRAQPADFVSELKVFWRKQRDDVHEFCSNHPIVDNFFVRKSHRVINGLLTPHSWTESD